MTVPAVQPQTSSATSTTRRSFATCSSFISRAASYFTKGVSVVESPVKRAISSAPVVKPIRITAPNSVFALGTAALPK